MKVRPLSDRDYPALLELLKLQDEEPRYRTMSPESRDLDALAEELGDATPFAEINPWVLTNEDALTAYLSLCNYEGEAFVEGPLMSPELTTEAVKPLLEQAVEAAKARGYGFVEAFVDEQNTRARRALEYAGFEPFRTTYIYELTRDGGSSVSAEETMFDFVVPDEIEIGEYRDLYRDTSDNWVTRLAWSDEELIERFEDPDVRLILAYWGSELVGHLELEFMPDEGYAEIAYFGVIPKARGKKLGKALLKKGIEEAFKHPETQLVLARAHDDEHQARRALEEVGFGLSHGVVALTHELER